jgi:hypothetical protein
MTRKHLRCFTSLHDDDEATSDSEVLLALFTGMRFETCGWKVVEHGSLKH